MGREIVRWGERRGIGGERDSEVGREIVRWGER